MLRDSENLDECIFEVYKPVEQIIAGTSTLSLTNVSHKLPAEFNETLPRPFSLI